MVKKESRTRIRKGINFLLIGLFTQVVPFHAEASFRNFCANIPKQLAKYFQQDLTLPPESQQKLTEIARLSSYDHNTRVRLAIDFLRASNETAEQKSKLWTQFAKDLSNALKKEYGFFYGFLVGFDSYKTNSQEGTYAFVSPKRTDNDGSKFYYSIFINTDGQVYMKKISPDRINSAKKNPLTVQDYITEK